ncbi:MAG: DNA polymerase ligase N-terminal domain-containing protein [Phycisphaerae bacterium]|jgi:hypothetical protein
MFVLLEHQPDPAAPQQPVHWDLLIELPEQELLATWRLAENPLDARDPIPAERIFDHDRRFLDYEGPLRSGRGAVRRLDRGPADVHEHAGDELRVTLHGQHVRGAYALIGTATGLELRRSM